MSAINTFTDNRFAYLATDGAAWNVVTGDITELGEKVLPFPSLGLVLAMTGRLAPPQLLAAINQEHSLMEAPTQRSIMAAVPGALRAWKRELDRDKAAVRGDRNGCAVYAALYDDDAGTPHALRVFTTSFPGAADAQAYQWIEGAFTMPALSPADLASVWPAGYPERPRDEMAAMFALQRRKSVTTIAGGCAVGGTCYFYRVGIDGVVGEAIMRFPDTVGSPTDPMAVADAMAGALMHIRAV